MDICKFNAYQYVQFLRTSLSDHMYTIEQSHIWYRFIPVFHAIVFHGQCEEIAQLVHHSFYKPKTRKVKFPFNMTTLIHFKTFL